jgi:hypothetical protein
MRSCEPWSKIVQYWSRCGLGSRAGATPDQVTAFEQKYGVVLPDDFRDYIEMVDGTGPNFLDDDYISFLSLSEIRPVHEFLDDADGVIYSDRFAYPDCFVFADYMLSCWMYAVEMTADRSTSGRVFQVTASDKPGGVEAETFEEFMQRYAADAESILFP